MNCPNCGTVLPQGAQNCPACGTMVAGGQGFGGYAPGFDPNAYTQGGYTQGFDPTAYGQRGYAQGYQQPPYGQGGAQSGYQQGYASYGQSGYGQGFDTAPGYGFQQGADHNKQGFQSVYTGSNAASAEPGALFNSISHLPRVIAGAFRDPGETLQQMMNRNDLFTGGIVAFFAILLTFLASMFMTRSVIASLFSSISSLTGTQMAGDAASMNQGINYIAGKMAAPLGGIAAVCELLAILLPAVVVIVYLCAIRKVRFSFVLISNIVALATLPSIAAAVLCMLASLISPLVGLAVILLGDMVSYVILCTVIARVTGEPEQHSVMTKIGIICTSEAVKLLFIQLIGGAMLGATLKAASALFVSLSSLI